MKRSNVIPFLYNLLSSSPGNACSRRIVPTTTMSITPLPGGTRATISYSVGGQFSQSPFPVNATWTNLGPLTTTFTPTPTSCTATPLGVVLVADNSDPTDGLLRYDCDWVPRRVPPYVQCQPSAAAYAPLYARGSTEYWKTFFSPGIHCPSEYSTAKAFTLSQGNVSSKTGIYFRTTGTHVFCCPRYENT